MTLKKYLTIGAAIIILTGAVLGWLGFGFKKNIIYFRNSENAVSDAPDSKIQNSAVPQAPKNLTNELAGFISGAIIAQNSGEKTKNAPDESWEMPRIDSMISQFFTKGLKQAGTDILDVASPSLTLSSDNSSPAVNRYIKEAADIMGGLKINGESPEDIIAAISRSGGQNPEKLYSLIAAFEAAADELEAKPVPSYLKNFIAEKIKILRITANILKALANIQSDPLAAAFAAKQFETVFEQDRNLQKKFDVFIKNLNRT